MIGALPNGNALHSYIGDALRTGGWIQWLDI